VLALLSKENGALLFVFCLVIECAVYRGRFASSGPRLLLYSWFFITVFVPATLVLAYTLLHPAWLLDSYNSMTNFGLYQRVLTEARVVWLYVQWILLPSNDQLGLFHDDILLSTGLWSPPSTLVAVVAHILLLTTLLVLWLRNKEPAFVLGIGIFYASHLIESTVLPLQLVHEHRNYIGGFGLLFGVSSLIASRSNLLCCGTSNFLRRLLIGGALLYFGMVFVVGYSRASSWGNGLKGTLIEARHHPMSASAHYEVGRQYAVLDNNGGSDAHGVAFRALAADAFRRAADLDPRNSDGLFGLLLLSAREHEPIAPELVAELTARLRSGPFYASSASWLFNLSRCYQNETCSVDRQDMVAIMQAAMDNPSLDHSGLTRSVALMAVAGFVANSGGNYRNALELSVAAANETPGSAQFQMNVINLAIAFGDVETAELWLQKMETGMGWMHADEIRALRDKLRAVRAGAAD